MASAFDRAERDRIGDHPRLEARLDREQSAEFAKHRHSLTPEQLSRDFEPLRS
jgi:hypothetical protein